jgi:ubiquinone/menaquinone biosynthesis C-methylase UbiE
MGRSDSMKRFDIHETAASDLTPDIEREQRSNRLFSWDSPVQYFDQVAATYASVDNQHTTGGRARRVRRARVMELFDMPGGRVLDVACGPGVLVEQMLNEGCEFWGVDASQRMIEECNKHFSDRRRTHFAVSDATSLPFDDGFFDAVTCLGIIDRIEDYELAVREMARVLRENGTFIIAVGNLLSPGAFWRNYIYSPAVALLRPVFYAIVRKPRKPAMSPVARLQRASAYRKLAVAAGCLPTDVVYFNFDLIPSPLNEWFPGISVAVAEKAEELRFGPLRWLGQGFLLKAKKLSNQQSAMSIHDAEVQPHG